MGDAFTNMNKARRKESSLTKMERAYLLRSHPHPDDPSLDNYVDLEEEYSEEIK